MGSVGLLIGLALVVGAGALMVNTRLSSLLSQAINEKSRLRYISTLIGIEATEMVASERGLAFAMMLQQNQQAEAMRNRFNQAQEQFQRHAQEYSAAVGTGPGSAEARAIMGSFETTRQLHSELRSLMDQQKMDQAIALLNERLLPQLSSMAESSKKLAAIQTQQIEALRATAEGTSAAGFWTLLILNVVALVVGLGVFYMVRQLTGTLRATVADLSESADHLGNTSKEVGSYSMSLSKSASDQAASLEETSASTEEIHSMTRSNADNSKQAASRMLEAAQRVEEANAALSEMVNSMNEISASSSKISKIIKVIDEIAFQTNILALNAAVEAARAGEAGMGFAVVADEVRNLAQRSAQAAKDTTQLIEESIQSATSGKQKLDQVARASESVNQLVKAVGSLVQEVRLGSEEQERGIEQIAKAVSQMERVTQQVAANAQEGAAAGEELRKHAAKVERSVDALQELVGASRSGHSSEQSRLRPAAKPERSEESASKRAGRSPITSRLSQLKSSIQTRNSGSTGHSTRSAVLDPKDPLPMDGDFEEF
jgi:methyl-accepting chemotaxis protein/methyl-accepting chemotaxis protein-1 (serine sensor receptor)